MAKYNIIIIISFQEWIMGDIQWWEEKGTIVMSVCIWLIWDLIEEHSPDNNDQVDQRI